MITGRRLIRAAVVVLLVAASAVWFACSDTGPGSSTGPAVAPPNAPRTVVGMLGALVAVRRHTPALLDMPGVVGTAVTSMADGSAGVLILTERPGLPGLPQVLDGVPVTVRVSGRLMAFSDPTQRQRPAPMGFSVGHPAITAGTIGARVRDALGNVYILSNNHVLANSNGANIGDPEYQPGPFDGGTAADQIATLSDFQVISFAANGSNTIDAAIALSTTAVLDNATPADDGYSMPNSTIYGDANGDGLFDNRDALLGLNVQKYGRTTKLTHGQITGVNATVTVCYAVSGFTCTKTARYVDQLIISPGTFSGGGDSGSLIVTDDANLNPVALLFAGSPSVTIANRIDLVLQRFGVTIDGFAPPPPGPLTDLAVTSISGPVAAVQGTASTITVSVKNVGNQNVSSFDVVLQDTTEHVTAGTQTVAGLAAGASTTLTFAWTPSLTGDHNLVAHQTLADDRATNDQRSLTIPVNAPVTDVAVASFSGPTSVIVGHGANIGVTVTNVGNQNVTSDITVTLQDSTVGVALGTQTIVGGLAAGASTTLVFPWNTTGAALGGHTLVATHGLTDANAANNRRSEVVTVTPKPTDIALTNATGPASVRQGDTAHVLVTVQNVGEVDVGTFTVLLTDGWAGPTAGTGTVAGLVAGGTITVDIAWNTAGAAITGHTLFATSQLADDNSANNSIGIAINVTTPSGPPPPPPPPPPGTDVAITSVTAPARVTQGDTAHVVVTVQNVGGQDVTSNFDLVLTDGFAGPELGRQTIAGLATGASVTRTINWNTASAAVTGHTLFASVNLADANTSNNTVGISVIVQAPPVTDVAVTSVVAPSAVTQGSTASIGVTVQNVGGLNVSGSFDVVLTDSASGVTIGTQTVTGLVVGASTTRTFLWNTTGAAVGGHTLVATQSLSDANTANNRGTASVAVNAPVTDVAVTGVSAPSSVTQGSTAAIGVTVQNVGGQNVSATFNVVLTDATAGVTVGTQSLSGLAIGASATRSFNWTTTGAALGGHTLVASQSLTDDNAANNQSSVTITVTPPPADLALAAITAPSQVTQGDTAAVVVTVQNVGGSDVTSSFDVVLTDATAGNAVLGTQTIAGLAAGASATRTFNWGTAGAAISGHILTATQELADNNGSNNAQSIAITVTAPSLHVGNLNGVATSSGNTWTATVQITVHDWRHNLVTGATVQGTWNGTGPNGTCTTAAGGNGVCSVVLSSIPNSTKAVSFAVTGMTLSGYVYKSSANHDPDGSSNGFSITVKRQ